MEFGVAAFLGGFWRRSVGRFGCAFLYWNFVANTRPPTLGRRVFAGLVLGCFSGSGSASFAGLEWEKEEKRGFNLPVLEYSKSFFRQNKSVHAHFAGPANTNPQKTSTQTPQKPTAPPTRQKHMESTTGQTDHRTSIGDVIVIEHIEVTEKTILIRLIDWEHSILAQHTSFSGFRCGFQVRT